MASYADSRDWAKCQVRPALPDRKAGTADFFYFCHEAVNEDINCFFRNTNFVHFSLSSLKQIVGIQV